MESNTITVSLSIRPEVAGRLIVGCTAAADFEVAVDFAPWSDSDLHERVGGSATLMWCDGFGSALLIAAFEEANGYEAAVLSLREHLLLDVPEWAVLSTRLP